MDRSPDFAPRWVSPPGETIRDVLVERGLSAEAFAASIGVPDFRLEGLLTGDETISINLARRISTSIGGSVEFWLTRDGQYRDDLTRVEADRWAQSLPISQMADFGWIDEPTGRQDRVESCLSFFDVPNVPEWRRTYGAMLDHAKFRASHKRQLDENATGAWLREAEREAAKLSCAPWDRVEFARSLPGLRSLTRVSDPKRFVPSLVASCASVGVALVVLRAPTGCPASGAARYLASGTPHIALSARYLSDDHLWFTFFHEAGHLVANDTQAVYVDEIGQTAGVPLSEEEREADAFATSVLLPTSIRERLPQRTPSATQLHQLSSEAGVSTGILVGQLQNAGVIGFNSRLNRLKRRYKWSGAILEKA
jgi:plasmid maintenance system antidote protein VapI